MKRLIGIIILLISSCSGTRNSNQTLLSIQFVDRHGVKETINAKERLKQYEKNDFLLPQPYEKVIRVFGKNEEGKVISKLTSYHPNAELRQYLEVIGNRANGLYKEWYQNGQLKVQASVIEGIGDLTTNALQSFVIDGMSRAWDEKGNLLAEFSYKKGVLEGESTYYFASGKVQSKIPYKSNHIHGIAVSYDEEGNIVGEASYDHGILEGKVYHEKTKDTAAFQEIYKRGKIEHGRYFDYQGEIISKVESGKGTKSFFEEGKFRKQYEVNRGILEGKVKIFDPNGLLENVYHIKKGEKHGDEWIYYPSSEKSKIQIAWHEGEIHGVVKTWYENGALESEKEMAHNKKHGMSFAWYQDGSMMLVEEYENDQLQKGSYFKRGQNAPVSKVVDGNGIATIYDSDGILIRKIDYQNGLPFE